MRPVARTIQDFRVRREWTIELPRRLGRIEPASMRQHTAVLTAPHKLENMSIYSGERYAMPFWILTPCLLGNDR
jgi:hypothetical protein